MIDLDARHATLVSRLRLMFICNDCLCQAYVGTNQHVTKMIEDDTTAYVDYLIGQTYNKLRRILITHPQQRAARIKPRCLVPANQEFPRWISSTLSSIGPLRIEDGPRD